MNDLNENENNALIDALKNITDVVSVMSNKLDVLDVEINKIKKQLILLQDKINTTKKKDFSNVELNTDVNSESNVEQSSIEQSGLEQTNDSYKNIDETAISTIGDTEIEQVRKNKAHILVDKLIQKKKEIDNKNEVNEFDEKNTVQQNIVTKRKNKIMRRF